MRRCRKQDRKFWVDGRQSGSNPANISKDPAAAVGRTGRSVPVLFQFANPNIAIADWVIVVLQGERQLLRPGGVRRADVVAGGAG